MADLIKSEWGSRILIMQAVSCQSVPLSHELKGITFKKGKSNLYVNEDFSVIFNLVKILMDLL